MGGGAVALDELAYADGQGVSWTYIPSRARHTAAYGSVYGPVHDWVKQRLDNKGEESLRPLTVMGNRAMDDVDDPRRRRVSTRLQN